MFIKKFSVRIVYDFKGDKNDYFNVEWAYYRLLPLYEPIRSYGNICKAYYNKPFKLEDAQYFAENLTIERVNEIEKDNKLNELKYLEKLKEIENYRKVRYIK